MRKSFVMFLLFVLCCNAFAQEVRIRQIGVKLEPSTLKVISDALYIQLDFYSRAFGKKKRTSFNARVFGKQREFQKYSKREMGFNPKKSRVLAYYDPQVDEMVLHVEIDDFEQTFKHELSHAIFEFYCSNHPLWITEGLAEFMESIDFVDGAYEFGDSYITKFLTAQRQFKDLEKLEDILDPSNFRSHDAYTNYTFAWSVIAYLFANDLELLYRVVRNSCDYGVAVLHSEYPGGMDALESDIRGYFFNQDPPEH